MCEVEFIDNNIYISCSLLSDIYKISDNTARQWKKRNIGERIYISNRAYINYDSIPIPTRKKLPTREEFIAIYKGKQSDEITANFFRRLENAYLKGFLQYRDIYKPLVKFEHITQYAQHHAVWAVILELHKQDKKPKLRNIWEAYSRIYPGNFVYNRMNYAINKATNEGIVNLLIKNRGRGPLINPVIEKWILDALSSGKGYSQYQIYDFVKELCNEFKYQLPSLSWVKSRCVALQAVVHDKTFGTAKNTYTKLPYAGIHRAKNPNSQWQIDGYTLPFYMAGYKKLSMFVVKDACTGRILGYDIARSENTETILNGIENAVNNTGVLPFEIVADNHSFNKTKEADYFKSVVEKIGTTWTVSENPRYKSIVERGFKTFAEKFFKKEYGYTGEGIKTKNPKGRTSQDLFDQYYTKVGGFLTEDQIKLIVISCIEKFNNKIGKDGKSPIMKYNEMKQPHCFKIDKADSLCLFIRGSEKRIRRGQIKMERAGVQYEYQLSKDLYVLLNDKEIRVRYTDFDEIHLFEPDTDKYIGSVPRKRYFHGAKADKTDEDIEILCKNSGRLRGIKTAFKQRRIDIAKAAEEADPEAAYAMNAKLTPKNIIEEFEHNGTLREQAERLGINLETVTKMPVFSEVQTERHDAKRNRRRESPFSPKNSTFRKLSLDEINTEE